MDDSSVYSGLGDRALQRIGPLQQVMYTQPPPAQSPAASSTSALRGPSRGNGPELRPINPTFNQVANSRDFSMVDNIDGTRVASHLEGSKPLSDHTIVPHGSSSQRAPITGSGATTGGLHTSSSDLSHTTFTDMADADLTPLMSTSSSGFSTHERSSQSESQASAKPATEKTAETDAENVLSMPLAPETLSNGSSLTPFPMSASKATATPRVELVQGQKRNAAGEVKPPSDGATPQSLGINRFLRGHSRTMSADSNGSMIAELSAHLRARLSYAASKVERTWQTRRGDDQLLPRLSGSPTSSTSTIQGPRNNLGFPHPEMRRDGDREFRIGSSDDMVMSMRDTLESHPSKSLNGLPAISSTGFPSSYHNSPSNNPPQISPLKTQQPPRLAPPVDIVSGSESNSRRRPNPNGLSVTSTYNPYPRHRRHYSEQELRSSGPSYPSNGVLVPGTPPLRPSQPQSHLHVSTPSTTSSMFPKQRTPSQNALMEQDAIETLLFMSSPENSGYHAGSQQRQPNLSTSIEAQMGWGVNGSGTQSSQTSEHQRPRKVGFMGRGTAVASAARPGQATGLEAQAGDEIDRLLDQMDDSESEDERPFSHSSHIGREPDGLERDPSSQPRPGR